MFGNRVGSLLVKQRNCLEFLQYRQGHIFAYITQDWADKTSTMMAQDTAENGLMTPTERSKNSQLKDEAARFKTNLLTQRGLFQGSITRLKKNIRNFHWLEENGLSVQNCH